MIISNSRPVQQALCCLCGELRTCVRPRNHVGEMNPLYQPRGDGHREVGDLKCANCGRITRHALLSPNRPENRDHDERMQRVALGSARPGLTDEELARLRRNYRYGSPRNPFLEHIFYAESLEKARTDGSVCAEALCGELAKVDVARFDYGDSYLVADYQEPEEVRDQEYEDPHTGMWWVAQDCVDCLRISNQMAARSKRDELLGALANLLANLNSCDMASVERLLSVVQAVTR